MFDKFIEAIIRFLNKTILAGYRARQWEKYTAPQGVVEDWCNCECSEDE